MGWVPPPAPLPGSSPEAIADHRAHLVRALGYDPAHRRQPASYFAGVWAAIIFTIVVWGVGLAYILSL